MKILVVTLYSGEAEYNSCCESLAIQKDVQITHEVIYNLPKREAHQRLYRTFNENRERFDFFAKLDADMVLARDDALATILGHFSRCVDAVSLTVWDRLTASRMWSFNLFRSTCVFEAEQNDALFTDRLPVRHDGKKVSIVDLDNLVLHAPEPSSRQAFVFGIHRAFKVMQPESDWPRLEASYHQMKILRKVWRNYCNNADSKAFLALCGAELVLSHRVTERQFTHKEDFYHYFDDIDPSGITPEFFFTAPNRHPMLDVLFLYRLSRFLRSTVSYIHRRGFNKVSEWLQHRYRG